MANRCPHLLQTTVPISPWEAACATPRSRLAVPDFTSVVPGAAVGRDRYARRRETLRAAFEAGLH